MRLKLGILILVGSGFEYVSEVPKCFTAECQFSGHYNCYRSPDKLRRSATTGQVSSCSELHSHQQANRYMTAYVRVQSVANRACCL